MKSLCYYSILLVLIIDFMSCKNNVKPDEPTSFLQTITESRYTPDDSLTVTYRFDQNNRLEREERRLPFAPGLIIDLYESEDLSQVYANQCRVHSYNAQKQEIAMKRYFSQSGKWSVYDADSLIYKGSQLVQQEHRDYFFSVDGGQYAFGFPLWLTKRTFAYDSQNRIASETDSVFINHDIPAGSTVLTKAPATYLHTNQLTYTHNEKGNVVQTVAMSGDAKKPMAYSNGWPVLGTEGKGYSSSVRMRFRPGTTTYAYAYDTNSRIVRKTVTYTDEKSAQNYVSNFVYTYGI